MQEPPLVKCCFYAAFLQRITYSIFIHSCWNCKYSLSCVYLQLLIYLFIFSSHLRVFFLSSISLPVLISALSLCCAVMRPGCWRSEFLKMAPDFIFAYTFYNFWLLWWSPLMNSGQTTACSSRSSSSMPWGIRILACLDCQMPKECSMTDHLSGAQRNQHGKSSTTKGHFFCEKLKIIPLLITI